MAEHIPLWTHDRIFSRMMEIIDEHEKSGKPAVAALHACNDLAYIVMYDCNAAIAELNATIERLRTELEAEQARTICAMCGEELTRMAGKP